MPNSTICLSDDLLYGLLLLDAKAEAKQMQEASYHSSDEKVWALLDWFKKYVPDMDRQLSSASYLDFVQLSRDLEAALGLQQWPSRSFPKATRVRVAKENGYRCVYCGRHGDEKQDPDGYSWHVDHMHPVSYGGMDTPDNLTLACRSCNITKWDSLAWVKGCNADGHMQRRKWHALEG
jgi:hypothetical protein